MSRSVSTSRPQSTPSYFRQLDPLRKTACSHLDQGQHFSLHETHRELALDDGWAHWTGQTDRHNRLTDDTNKTHRHNIKP